MTDPTARAREEVESLAASMCEAFYHAFPKSDHHDSQPCDFCVTRVRNAAAAIRRATLDEVRGKVEGMKQYGAHPDDYYYTLVALRDVVDPDGYDKFVDRDAVLATLSGDGT